MILVVFGVLVEPRVAWFDFSGPLPEDENLLTIYVESGVNAGPPPIQCCGRSRFNNFPLRSNRQLLSNSISQPPLCWISSRKCRRFRLNPSSRLLLYFSAHEHHLTAVGIDDRSCPDMRRRIFTCRKGDSRQAVPTKFFAGESISVHAMFDFCKIGRSITMDCHPTSVGSARACGCVNR